MAKRINCKHDLNEKEELLARELKRQLEKGDHEYNELIREMYKEWFMKPKESFFDWLSNRKDRVLSSALRRLEDWQKIIL